MHTGILVGLVAASLLGVGVVGTSAVMAPGWGGMGGTQASMGGGMMGGGMHDGGMYDGGMMGDGTCDCGTYCQQHAYHHNYTWGG